MSHGAGKGHGKKRGGHEEEHENHERWAVSYADMMTVLMALFLVLFAMSTIDTKKFEMLRTSLAKGFGNEALPTDGGSGIQDGSDNSSLSINPDAAPVTIEQSDGSGQSTTSGSSANSSSSASGSSAVMPDSTSVVGPAQGTGAGDELAARSEAAHLSAIQAAISAALAAKGLQGDVDMKIDSRGLEINVVNDVFFTSASAAIQPAGLAVLDALGPVLAQQKEAISIEGHTNSLKISSAQYPTNWELSGARAISVLRHLSEQDGVAPDRVEERGFADTRPLYANDDPRAVNGNRRVDIVVESDASPEVNALVPSFVGADQSQPSPATATNTAASPGTAS